MYVNVIYFLALIFLFICVHILDCVGGHSEAPGAGDPVLPVSTQSVGHVACYFFLGVNCV